MESLKGSSHFGEDSKLTDIDPKPRWLRGRENLKNKQLRLNLDERKKYTRHLFAMLCLWLIMMLVIVCLNAIGRIPGTVMNFTMSDAVIITLISTTTANIAAFFLVVTKYLFPITTND